MSSSWQNSFWESDWDLQLCYYYPYYYWEEEDDDDDDDEVGCVVDDHDKNDNKYGMTQDDEKRSELVRTRTIAQADNNAFFFILLA